MDKIGWIAIFRTGKHTDSAGNESVWTEQDLDRMVSTYDPAGHEAPVVIGHPKDNAPAYAWVAALKRQGDTLLMQMKDIVPEFGAMLANRMFKKRSIALYPDRSLRHVGFLGALPPAVKGLPDFAFGNDGSMVIEFEENNSPQSPLILSGEEKEKTKKEEKRMKFFEWLKGQAAKEGVTLEDLPQSFSEADVKAAAEKAAKEASEKAAAEFAEAQKLKDTEYKAREDALRKKEAEAKKKAVAEFCEGLKAKGILTPAMEKLGMGVTAFMQAIAEVGTTVEFGEGDNKASQSPLEFAQAFLAALPPSIEFKEVAGRSKETKTGGSAGDRIEALVKEKMKADTALTYGAAFTEVQHENPELAAEYAEEITG